MQNKYSPSSGVAELQGLYGPLQILEKTVQELWALQSLQPGDWRTRNGRRLKVVHPGQWNRGAGPDFRGAVIELDGESRMGDIELHLYREDWWRHGHNLDPAYNEVILHVVLFAGGLEYEISTPSGSVPEEWVMGAWMREDVESVSGGEPGIFGELEPELKDWLESDQPEAVRERLRIGADRRWQAKESMASCLLRHTGWEGTLHRMMLYYLGFPYNRSVFFEIAEAIPAGEWRQPDVLDRIQNDWGGRIRWGAGRPANRAGPRLKAYADLNQWLPGWAARLERPPPILLDAVHDLMAVGSPPRPTRSVRQAGRQAAWRRWLAGEVLADCLNHGLVDRLWVDVFLPVMIADGCLEPEGGQLIWFHAAPGHYPDAFIDLLKLAGIRADPSLPLCNGWVQGLLWAEDQLRLERVRSSLGQGGTARHGSGA